MAAFTVPYVQMDHRGARGETFRSRLDKFGFRQGQSGVVGFAAPAAIGRNSDGNG
jgi:hypothetical protein